MSTGMGKPSLGSWSHSLTHTSHISFPGVSPFFLLIIPLVTRQCFEKPSAAFLTLHWG